MVREGKLLETDTLSELGIFGSFLRRGDKVLLNNEAGHLIRTKVTTCTLCSVLSWLLITLKPSCCFCILNNTDASHVLLCCPGGCETMVAMSNSVHKHCKAAHEFITPPE